MSSRRSVLMVLLGALILPLSGCGHRAVLPPSTSAVDVTWSQPYLPGGEALGAAGQRHLTGAATTTIVGWLNGLTSWRSSDTCDACPFPLFYGAEPVFTFHLAGGTAVFAYKNDYEVDVTVDGRRRRTLSAWSSLSDLDSETLLREMLHVAPPSAG